MSRFYGSLCIDHVVRFASTYSRE